MVSNTEKPNTEKSNTEKPNTEKPIKAKTVKERRERPAQNAREEQVRAAALKRPPEEWVLRKRQDRVKPFLLRHMEQFVFNEFSEDILKALKAENLLASVPVPLRAADLTDFKDGRKLPVAVIAENMAWVIGIDPVFRYADAYIAFIMRFTGKKAVDLFVKIAGVAADHEAYDEACIHYRAALAIKPDDMHALYGYARVCRAMYNNSTEELYIGNFKAEALSDFELTTELYPKFDQGWYYLGFMYLNMGLYTKAHLAWERFMLLAKEKDAKEARQEIRRRMEQIRTPMEIERGTLEVMSGRWQSGVTILESFAESVYSDWWPLWYHLGEAYHGLGRDKEALEAYLRVLRVDGSNIPTMEKLIVLYAAAGNDEKVKKYADKIALLKQG